MKPKKIKPEEFLKQMTEISKDWDCESAHIEADKLMEKTLEALGYAAGIEVFRNMSKCYS